MEAKSTPLGMAFRCYADCRSTKRHKQPPPTSRSRTTTMKSTPPACHHSRPRGEDQPTATSRFDRREHALYTEIAEDEPPLIALTAGAENRRRTSNWKPYSKYSAESRKTYIYPKNYLDTSPPIGKRRRRSSGSDWKHRRVLGYYSLGEKKKGRECAVNGHTRSARLERARIELATTELQDVRMYGQIVPGLAESTTIKSSNLLTFERAWTSPLSPSTVKGDFFALPHQPPHRRRSARILASGGRSGGGRLGIRWIAVCI
jgi:hypothetical protein